MAVRIIFKTITGHIKTLTVLISISASGVCAAQGSAATDSANAYELLASAARAAAENEFTHSAERIEIELPVPDPRLQWPACLSELETSVGRHNGQGGRLNVRVECRDAAPWARNMAVNVRVYREVLVASRNLPRGALISEADIRAEEVDISQLRGQAVDDRQIAVGMEVRRNINTGTVLSTDMLDAPLVVRRGDAVMLTAERGGVSIRQQGTAMQDGVSGKQISVRNTSSDRVVQAIVTGHGEARVLF